jgi:hypothetical protein
MMSSEKLVLQPALFGRSAQNLRMSVSAAVDHWTLWSFLTAVGPIGRVEASELVEATIESNNGKLQPKGTFAVDGLSRGLSHVSRGSLQTQP